jgi:molybdopterin-biosynthesis enzyme MoeA-like protein
MCVEIVSIGFGLRLGHRGHQGRVYRARHLGYDRPGLVQRATVADNQTRVAKAVAVTLGRAEVVLTLSPSNRKRARIPRGAIPLAKPVGTALCFIVEQGERSVISLPGVP